MSERDDLVDSQFISNGMAIGAGFVTDVLAKVAINQLRELPPAKRNGATSTNGSVAEASPGAAEEPEVVSVSSENPEIASDDRQEAHVASVDEPEADTVATIEYSEIIGAQSPHVETINDVETIDHEDVMPEDAEALYSEDARAMTPEEAQPTQPDDRQPTMIDTGDQKALESAKTPVQSHVSHDQSPQSDTGRGEPVRVVPLKKRELQLPKVIGADVEATVAFSSDDAGVFGSLEFLEGNWKRASYVAKIVNDSDDDLYCARFGETGSRRTELQPSEFIVEPHSASAVIIDVPLKLWNRYDTVLVTMRNRIVHSSINARVPQSSFFAPVAVAICALALTIAAVAAYAIAKPAITAYAVPSALLAGMPVRAAYATRGIGAASYEIADLGDKNQHIVASGTLGTGQGFFTFNTPMKPDRYRFSLHVKGPFGAVTQEQVLETVSAAAARPASKVLQLIRSFEVDDALVQSGAPIVTRYIANGKGQVRLLDASQIPVAVQTTSPHGTNSIPAPDVDKDTPFRLELVSKSGNSTQTASVGILVQPGGKITDITGDSVTDAGNLSALNTSDVAAINAASNVAGGSKFMRITPNFVRSGSPFHVRVLQNVTHLQITLQNAQGVPITTRMAGNTQRTLSFTAPEVPTDSNFLLIANFQQANGNQTLLQPFTVHATH